MAKTFDFRRYRSPALNQDEEIWHDLRVSLREQFPNPQRIGCPGSAVLKQLAQGTLRLEQVDAWLDHFAHCSPCFCDFEDLRLRVKRRRHLVWGRSAAAAIIFSSILGVWLTQKHDKVNGPTKFVQLRSAHALQISLHFEDATSSRSTVDEPEARLQHLPRRAISLSIYLPPGSEAGNYEIIFLRKRPETAPLVAFAGNADIESGAVVLRTTPDLSGLQPGTYTLAVRSAGGRLRYFPVVIS